MTLRRDHLFQNRVNAIYAVAVLMSTRRLIFCAVARMFWDVLTKNFKKFVERLEVYDFMYNQYGTLLELHRRLTENPPIQGDVLGHLEEQLMVAFGPISIIFPPQVQNGFAVRGFVASYFQTALCHYATLKNASAITGSPFMLRGYRKLIAIREDIRCIDKGFYPDLYYSADIKGLYNEILATRDTASGEYQRDLILMLADNLEEMQCAPDAIKHLRAHKQAHFLGCWVLESMRQ